MYRVAASYKRQKNNYNDNDVVVVAAVVVVVVVADGDVLFVLLDVYGPRLRQQKMFEF